MNIYNNYSDYKGLWSWDNFKPREIACKHCGEMYLNHRTMDALQSLREIWGKPIVITSAHRCVEHNAKIGGAANSQHLTIAFDCVCPEEEQNAFVRAAKQAGFLGTGKYPGKGFVHIDMGPRRDWRG